MASAGFLELQGIDGETEDKEFKSKKAIDIESWSWGASRSGTAVRGGGGTGGVGQVSDLHFTKMMDKASPNLMKYVLDGTGIKKAKLTLLKSAGKDGKRLPFLVLEFEEVTLTSYQTGGSGQDSNVIPHESGSLGFKKHKFTYTGQKSDNTPDAPVESHWDAAQGA